MNNQVERFYRVREVCKIFGISRATLYRRIDANEIDPPLKNGGLVHWPESSIAKYQQRIKDAQA